MTDRNDNPGSGGGPGGLGMLGNIPAELRAKRIWACARPDKAPVNPATGWLASATEPSTWVSFEETYEGVASGRYPYLGYMHDGEHTTVDLDDKPSRPATEEQRERHRQILDAASGRGANGVTCNTYIERSCSGTGYHIIARGRLPTSLNRDRVEAYSEKRFMIATGDVVNAAPVADGQALLDVLYREMGGRTPQAQAERDPFPEEYVLSQTRERLGDLFDRLWAGDWAGYGSQSEADFALAIPLARYAADFRQWRELFLRSGLGAAIDRKKTTKNQEKYLEITYENALDRAENERRQEEHGHWLAARMLTATPCGLETRIITPALLASPPVERFVCGSLFPFGKASLLFGPHGGGKSAFLAQLVFTFAGHADDALATTFLGMLVRHGGAVLVYSAEDTFDDWVRKAAAFAAAYADKPDMLALLERALTRVHVADRTGVVARLSEVVQVRAGSRDTSVVRRVPQRTPEWCAIRDRALAVRAGLTIIETTSRLVDDEDNTSMASHIGACGHLAEETAGAVITTHHPTKAAERENDPSGTGARGGSALVNNARTVVSLFPASPEAFQERWRDRMAAADLLTLEHTKSTSSVMRQEDITLVRTPTPWGAVLRRPDEYLGSTPAPQEARVLHLGVERERRRRDERLRRLHDVVSDIKATLGGTVSLNKLQNEFRGRLRMGKHTIPDLVAEALALKVLKETRDAAGRILDLEPGVRPEEGGDDAGG